MLFVSTSPIQTYVFDDRKVIVLTNNKLMFSHLDFIEQYLAMPLITTRPIKMYYEPSVMQTMVISETTIQIYYCDWKTQIKLIKVIILNNESVDGVCYDKESGWHIFGTLTQYEPTRINFHKSMDKDSNILAKCFIDRNKYVLTDTKLQKSEGIQEPKDVTWKDRMMVLRNCNFKIEMSGASTLDKKRDVLCINGTYIILISRFEAIQTIVQPAIVYFSNSLLISNVENGKLTTIQKCQGNSYGELGTIQKQNGSISGAFLYDEQLMLLEYEDKEIHLHSIPLVSDTESSHQPKKAKKKLFQSISRIMEESHQDGSQFIPRDQKQSQHKYPSIEGSHKTQTQYHPNQKPIIRDISVNDEEVKSNPLNDSASQVLSRSGLEGQKQSQADILSGQDDEHMSFDNQNMNQIRKNHKDKFKSVPVKGKSKFSSENFKADTVSQKLQKQKQQEKKNNSFTALDASIQKSNQSKSKKRGSAKRPGPGNKSPKNESFSQNENTSFQEHPETPAFGFEAFGNDRWGSFDRQWNNNNTQVGKVQINEQAEEDMQESLCIQDQKSILKFMPQKHSKKVETFKPQGALMTTQLYNKIQKTSYCSLISKALEADSDKLQQYMDLFLPNVLQEQQAPLFFQKNIRTFNPQFTKDKIKTLFKSLICKQQYKSKMTSALQLFKISQVPPQVLCFSPDFIKVMNLLCKQIYIEDLLKPTQATIDYFMSSYFNIDNFTQEVITIQDQQIDITHPRNMLNILLYLNEYLGVKIEIIIKVYCAKLLEEDHLDILKKITVKENIFEICEVSKSVLDDVIIERFNQLLNQSVQNAEYLWNIIEFLNEKLINQYRIRLALISQFNKCNIIFDLEFFIWIKRPENDIYVFLQKIIAENSCRNLANLKFSSIYRSLYWLQEGQRISRVTNQYIELVKTLAEKFCGKKMFYHAFNILNTVLPKIKMSFIAKMLRNYLKSKYLNRLAQHAQIEDLLYVFPQMMKNPEVDLAGLPHDKVKIPQFSRSLSCPWGKFLTIFDKYLDGPIELKILVYNEINIANQLYLSLDETLKQKFTKFLAEIQENIIIDLDDMNENDNSLNPKGATSLQFQDQAKEDLESQIATSTLNREEVLLNEGEQKNNRKTVYKSMTLIDHFNDINHQHKLPRRNSDKKHNSENVLNTNEDLMRVKLLVNKKEIIDELREIYSTKNQEVFVRSLKLVDLEKLELYHLDVFKAIVYKEIAYSISRILPFEVFLTKNLDQAFELSRQKITSEINVRNFWVILAIVELMFRCGSEVCNIFINKCVVYLRNDNYTEILGKILQIVRPKFNPTFLKEMTQQANGYGLTLTAKLLELYHN